MLNTQENKQYIETIWDNSIIPALIDYIAIPNKSPMFDPQWQEHGYMEKAVSLIVNWCQQHAIPGMQLEVIRLENRTPVIVIEVPGQGDSSVLLYGHLDKQPEMSGWEQGLDPWRGVLRDDKLYGRGGADDGYSAFASLLALKALHEQKIPHAKALILIEACEESGSYDLPFYIDHLKQRIGTPNLVICLDSGCGNYQQLWLTNSLRGILGGTLTIKMLTEGVHSGAASGIVPSVFRILRLLLARIENASNGQIILEDLFTPIPMQRIAQAELTADTLGPLLYSEFPFVAAAEPEQASLVELLLNRTWRPTLTITGCNGLPAIENAGNVALPEISVRLSLRLPPTCDPQKAAQALKTTLEHNPPFNAYTEFQLQDMAKGWNAPIEKQWLIDAAQSASQKYFGQKALYFGEGGTIPFMGMLGEKFPEAQFLITGVLGPKSNAHGPNEFLHIPTAKKLTCCVADIIAEHFTKSN
jgi:acetylornithine deacetylase/succinyl-diaminopimelate desuccinylase-like protein